ncbi:hypothetical protein B0H34DRAFT_801407 [Crassisporium funariophilum]|nr:hypothetical protein B0H34DRAFT_801407 [Crassisporium funariophilum]
MAKTINNELFPAPSHGAALATQQSSFVPHTWPGVSVSSTAAIQSILIDNQKRFHVFFNERGFHNHVAHTALTLWCLGADEATLETTYKMHADYQKATYASPSPITHGSWRDHLGDEHYYQAYLQFFISELRDKSHDVLLEEYIFAPNANVVESEVKHPEMLSRFFAGLLHPFIHTGLAVEFGLPGNFAEGLAQAAVHKLDSTSISLIPASSFEHTGVSLVSRFTQAVGMSDKTKPTNKTHAFTILAKVLNDPRFTPGKQPDEFSFYIESVAKSGEAIREYVDQWSLDGDIEKKVEELLWTNVLIYGIGGSEKSGNFNADFFHMHLVTSSLFLPSVISRLKRSSQELLLRGYFATCLAWYISRGRPELDIARFFGNSATLHPTAPGPQPTPHKDAIPTPSSSVAITPNPWLQIIQTTLSHPDDHLPKLQRALSEYASHFGTIPAGYFKDTELKNAELIDGTLFLRVAGLTATRLGWVREGEAPLGDGWDRRGFYREPKL